MTVNELHLQLEALINEGYEGLEVGVVDTVNDKLTFSLSLTLLQQGDEMFIGVKHDS
jgi:hypothetical protein